MSTELGQRNQRTRSQTLRKSYAKSEPKISSRFYDFLADLDLFGEKVNFTFKGRETFPTIPGITVSVFLLIIIGIFAVNKCI